MNSLLDKANVRSCVYMNHQTIQLKKVPFSLCGYVRSTWAFGVLQFITLHQCHGHHIIISRIHIDLLNSHG